MPRLDPGLMPVVSDLTRGLQELGIPFGIVGALVPELLLDARPDRRTNDADVVVVVESLPDFNGLKDRLADYGFTRTGLPHRLQRGDGGWVDILPFSEAIAPDGYLELEEGFVLNMAGFGQVVPNAVSVPIDGGPTVPVAPLPLYVLLKLVAFNDREQTKDLAGVVHCLEHYLEEDDRRYGVDHNGEGVPYECTCAYLLGVDARSFLDEPVSNAARLVLGRLDDPDATVIGDVIHETGRFPVEDERRRETVEFFRWYRLGTGL